VLVFTEYSDTLEYLRDNLVTHYGKSIGCYSGAGGELGDGEKWQIVTKDEITKALNKGELKALICTDAASEGLNLQAAGAVINYDLPWNPSRATHWPRRPNWSSSRRRSRRQFVPCKRD
jgi:ERCC4-related helicase